MPIEVQHRLGASADNGVKRLTENAALRHTRTVAG
jgi:hypothetical protein